MQPDSLNTQFYLACFWLHSSAWARK